MHLNPDFFFVLKQCSALMMINIKANIFFQKITVYIKYINSEYVQNITDIFTLFEE